jgi:Putative transposase/Transposase zinc-binding domain
MAERLSLQTVLDQYLHENPRGLHCSAHQWQVCHHILACRTEALGATRFECERCGQESRFYCACRDRHCPRCQRQASHAWCERQRANTLAVAYYHVIFTLPQGVNPLAELHPEVIYDQLLKSAWATLATLAADPKRLHGQLGATLVLHTWGQTLVRHLHVHCLVPGGALTDQGTWKAARSTYLFPVRALARYFRGHFVHHLRQRHQLGQLPRVQDAQALTRQLDTLMRSDWVVYTKACLNHTDTVVDYLGRYSHRIALSDSRLVGRQAGQVQLRYRDYRDHDRTKVLTLSAEELIRRFLLHVLPPGFMRIRHCGFLANRCRRAKLARIREAIGQAAFESKTNAVDKPDAPRYRCPHCGQRALKVVAVVLPSWRNLLLKIPLKMNRSLH